ncbi:transcription antitermination factor NusB [Youxingia wuxianensis]|uniref:Transcription antitermination protein NusB n=1 Tax=Youxingia wuxianensis TaxID=2763678 RepID=A0A926IH00_9FIRM|nr:transcription antitermination factor NusB [Youxingia wuxianensis]MBC8584203.1 transcription antitermination factor NusB [Youxingia wuxianensis]
MKHMKRSEAREQAFILVFERSFKDETIDEIIEEAQIGRNLEVDPYARQLASGVSDHMPWLDETISTYSKKWKLNRMSRVALSILRMSLWEIDHVDTVPVGASINEAVELAKKYGNEDDFSFVNGVLGAYVRAKAPLQEENLPEMEQTEDKKIFSEEE